MQSRAKAVNGANVQGKSAFLPGEACCRAVWDGNPNREVGLREQESAEAIVPLPSEWEGLNVKRGQELEQFVG